MADSFNAATSQNSSHFPIEQFVPAVRQQNGIYTQLPVVVDSSLTATGVIKGKSLDVTDSTVAIAGTTAATLGDTGGTTGPATAAQNSWLEVNVNGSNYFVPLWQ
jgi:hypothetical protein